MVDHHVDRPDVKAPQGVQLTGTNRSFDLIVLILNEDQDSAQADQRTETQTSEDGSSALRVRSLLQTTSLRPGQNEITGRNPVPCSVVRPPSPVMPFAGLVAFAR